MLKSAYAHINAWIIASRRNDFHPHLIARRGLLAVFALILAAEAFMVSNVISVQSGAPPLAAAAAVRGLPPGISAIARYWLQYVIVPLLGLAAQPGAGRIAEITLLIVAAALMGSLAHTLSVRRRYFRPVGYIAGGTMLAFAVTILFFDTHLLLPALATPQMSAPEPAIADQLPGAAPRRGRAGAFFGLPAFIVATSTASHP